MPTTIESVMARLSREVNSIGSVSSLGDSIGRSTWRDEVSSVGPQNERESDGRSDEKSKSKIEIRQHDLVCIEDANDHRAGAHWNRRACGFVDAPSDEDDTHDEQDFGNNADGQGGLQFARAPTCCVP